MAGLGWSPRRLGRLAGWLVVALALGFVGHELWHNSPWGLAGARASELAFAIAVGTLAYGLAGFLLAEAWRGLLGPGPAEAEPRRHRALYGRSQIAKYLPGNCFHFVGRQVLGHRLGHPHRALALASLAEVVSLLLIAGILAWPLLWSRVEPTFDVPPAWLVAASAAAVLVLACLNRRRIRDWRAGVEPWPRGAVRRWAPRAARAGLLHATFFAVAGLILWGLATVIEVPGAPGLGPATAISTLAAAWWFGFVVPGSSAGAGVREAVLVLTLEPYLASEGAMLLALAMRAITTFGDLLFFALCVLTRWDGAADQDAGDADRQSIPHQPDPAPPAGPGRLHQRRPA